MSKEIDLVMSGSGVRLPAFVGAIDELMRREYTIKRVAGTSGGSIIAAFLAQGWSRHGLINLAMDVDFNNFKDISLWSMFTKCGYCSGNKLEEWLEYKLRGARFKDLKLECRVVASDAMSGDSIIFSQETTPNMKVSEAVRMSTGIPLFFAYKNYKDKIVVDGGLVNNYFIDTFDDNERPTFGLKLKSTKSDRRNSKISFIKYVTSLIDSMIIASEKEHMEDADWARTIYISTGTVSSTNFSLTEVVKEKLFAQGKESTKLWLDVYEEGSGETT